MPPRFRTIIGVPFLNPPQGPPPLRFLNRMTGAPIWNVIVCGGIPESVTEFRKSTGYASHKSYSATLSADRYVFAWPGNLVMMISLILSTLSFLGASIALLATQYLSVYPSSIFGNTFSSHPLCQPNIYSCGFESCPISGYSLALPSPIVSKYDEKSIYLLQLSYLQSTSIV